MSDFTEWLKARIIAGFQSPGEDHHRSTTWVAMRMIQIHTDENGSCKICKTPFPCLTLRVCTYPYGSADGAERPEGWRDEWDFTMEEIHGPPQYETFARVWFEDGSERFVRLGDLPPDVRSASEAPQARSIPDGRESGDDPNGGACDHIDEHGAINPEGGCDRCET